MCFLTNYKYECSIFILEPIKYSFVNLPLPLNMPLPTFQLLTLKLDFLENDLLCFQRSHCKMPQSPLQRIAVVAE